MSKESQTFLQTNNPKLLSELLNNTNKLENLATELNPNNHEKTKTSLIMLQELLKNSILSTF